MDGCNSTSAPMRECTCCKELKQLECFNRNATQPLGRDYWCRLCLQTKRREFRNKNLEACRESDRRRAKKVYTTNRDRVNQLRREYYHRRKLTDYRYVLNKRMRTLVWISLKSRGVEKDRSWLDLVGSTLEEFYKHVERQFSHGMSWDNMGEWHIDHIVPLSEFRYSSVDDEDFKRAWSLSNLRPLWAADNIRKGGARTHLL